jgi:hypothetical protein
MRGLVAFLSVTRTRFLSSISTPFRRRPPCRTTCALTPCAPPAVTPGGRACDRAHARPRCLSVGHPDSLSLFDLDALSPPATMPHDLRLDARL